MLNRVITLTIIFDVLKLVSFFFQSFFRHTIYAKYKQTNDHASIPSKFYDCHILRPQNGQIYQKLEVAKVL